MMNYHDLSGDRPALITHSGVGASKALTLGASSIPVTPPPPEEVTLNIVAPLIAGEVYPGRVIAADDGEWEHPEEFEYQWLLDGDEVSAASSVTVAVDWLGSSLQLAVTSNGVRAVSNILPAVTEIAVDRLIDISGNRRHAEYVYNRSTRRLSDDYLYNSEIAGVYRTSADPIPTDDPAVSISGGFTTSDEVTVIRVRHADDTRSQVVDFSGGRHAREDRGYTSLYWMDQESGALAVASDVLRRRINGQNITNDERRPSSPNNIITRADLYSVFIDGVGKAVLTDIFIPEESYNWGQFEMFGGNNERWTVHGALYEFVVGIGLTADEIDRAEAYLARKHDITLHADHPLSYDEGDAPPDLLFDDPLSLGSKLWGWYDMSRISHAGVLTMEGIPA